MKAKTKQISELKEEIIETPQGQDIYDRSIPQTIPLELVQNGRTFRLTHTLAPLSDERYFEYERQQAANAKRIVKQDKLSIEFYAAKEALWNDLATGRTGYKETPDWKLKTHILDKVQVIDALLKAHVVDVPEDALEAEILFDDDALTEIRMHVMHSNTLLSVSHFFRQESKAELDEFLSIMSSGQNATALASAAKKTESERAASLYDKVCESATGYADSGVPAYHKEAAVAAFFSGQLARLGKS